jgi:hypothetical protein
MRDLQKNLAKTLSIPTNEKSTEMATKITKKEKQERHNQALKGEFENLCLHSIEQMPSDHKLS